MGNTIRSGRRETVGAVANSQVKSERKVIIVGCGDTGKSTFFKHLGVVNGEKYNQEVLLDYRFIVFANIIRYMRGLCEQVVRYDLTQECKEAVNYIQSLEDDFVLYVDKIWTPTLTSHIKTLWQSKEAQTVFIDRYKLWCNFHGETLLHFMKHFDEMEDPNWIPTPKDVLCARVKTTGIIEKEITIANTKLKFLDVGGQRGERKKWYHIYPNTNCVVFVVSIAEYGTLCYEDCETNRTKESLRAFEETVNSKYFAGIPFVLLLNRADELEHTMQRCPVRSVFPDYTGNNLDLNCVSTFFKDKFLGQYRGEEKNKILPVMVNSLDEESVKNALVKIAAISIAGNTIGQYFEVWPSKQIYTMFAKVNSRQSFADVVVNTN